MIGRFRVALQYVRHADGVVSLRHGRDFLAVYTPGEQLSRVYASACVAALSQRMLDEGRTFRCLYADISNRTPNDIYMSIGYEPVCDPD